MRRAAAIACAAWLALLVSACGSGGSGQELAVFSGSKPVADAGRFAPPGAWDLKYSWDCAKEIAEGVPGARGIELVVYNSDDDSTAFEHPETSSAALHGSGVLSYRRAGDYYLGLQTYCDWQVTIVDRS